MKRLFFLINFSFLISHFSFGASVLSPNGNIELKFSLSEFGQPVYEVTYKNRPVIKPSHLGLELAKDKHASMGMREHDLLEGFTIAKEETTTFDETWRPVWGETATIRNHYNEYAVTLSQKWLDRLPSNPDGPRLAPRQYNRTMIIRFRVYDDGVGFRYEFPQQRDLTYFLIKEEKSEFAMLATMWPGGFLATTTPRSRRPSRRVSLRFEIVSKRLSIGLTRRLPFSRRPACRPLCR